VYRNPDRSAYIPSQIHSTPLSNSILESTSPDEPKLLIEVGTPTPQTPTITPPTNLTPTTFRSSNSTMKPTRRKSTPASLNKGYTHSHDALFVPHTSILSSSSIESSPMKPLAGSVPKDFFSPTRHSAGGKLKSQSISTTSSPAPGSLKKIFTPTQCQDEEEEDEGREGEGRGGKVIRYQSVEKSGLAMALEFDD
jgi:hypothetical protein